MDDAASLLDFLSLRTILDSPALASHDCTTSVLHNPPVGKRKRFKARSSRDRDGTNWSYRVNGQINLAADPGRKTRLQDSYVMEHLTQS